MFRISLFVIVSATLMLSSCTKGEPNFPKTKRELEAEKIGTITGKKGITLFGKSKQNGNNITVNSYLWQASLDTLHTAPIQKADPFGGIISTDWYTVDSKFSERFKINVYILGSDLRADAVRVAMFKQVKRNNSWQDAPVSPEVSSKLEEAILTKARDIKFKSK